MVDLYIVRHAIAFERDAARWPDDRARPLTPDGVRKFRKAARGLRQVAGAVPRVLVSPLVRAKQTAELLTLEAGWPAAQEEAAIVARCARRRDSAALAVVGHEPQLSALLALCLDAGGSERASDAFVLKKGGAACLSWDGAPRAGKARLVWLLTPKLLRALR